MRNTRDAFGDTHSTRLPLGGAPGAARRRFCGGLAGGLLTTAAGWLAPRPARAAKSATLVYGYAQGSAADGVLAAVIRAMQGRPGLGVAPTVRYMPGKGSSLAAAAVRRGPSDGSLILCAPSTVLTLGPQLASAELSEALAGLRPVVPVARLTFAVIVGPRVPANVGDMKQLKAWYAENPGEARLGLPGVNTASHFMAMEMQEALELGVKFAMYQGSGDIVPDLLSGALPAAVIFAGGSDVNFTSGRLRRLAITSRARWPALPDVATALEQGVPDAVAEESFGLHVHPDTPLATVSEIAEAVNALTQDAAVQKALGQSGWLPVPSPPSPDAFREMLLGESKVWQRRIAMSIARR